MLAVGCSAVPKALCCSSHSFLPKQPEVHSRSAALEGKQGEKLWLTRARFASAAVNREQSTCHHSFRSLIQKLSIIYKGNVQQQPRQRWEKRPCCFFLEELPLPAGRASGAGLSASGHGTALLHGTQPAKVTALPAGLASQEAKRNTSWATSPRRLVGDSVPRGKGPASLGWVQGVWCENQTPPWEGFGTWDRSQGRHLGLGVEGEATRAAAATFKQSAI